MKKEYIKPEAEVIDFLVIEEITSDEDLGGLPGEGSNVPGDWV